MRGSPSASCSGVAPECNTKPSATAGWRAGGLSTSIAYGTPAGKRWLSPRIGLGAHSAGADASRINVLRLDAGILLEPPSPLGSIAPFLCVDGGVYRADYDRCGVPVLQDGNNLAQDSCSGSRTGLGYQAGAGTLLRARRGPAPFAQIRYMQSGRGVDGVLFLVGAMF